MTEPQGHRILVIEDDLTLKAMMVDQMTRLGHDVRGAGSRAEALAQLSSFLPELALLDLGLPDTDGLTFLPELREYCPVVVVTAQASINLAVRAVRAGAADYLVKPVTPQNLALTLHRFFETLELWRDLAYWQSMAHASSAPRLIGDGPAVVELRRLIALFAQAATPVLILGEAGTGKEMAARIIHASGPRVNGRFISVDCDAGVDPAELFGSWRAGARMEGLLNAAERGTLFLSGVDRLSPELQMRLLRAMETRSYRPVGSSASLTVDTRFILSATLSDAQLREAAAGNQLLQYLSAFVIEIPPLRDRPGDIAELARQFLNMRDFQRDTTKELTEPALRALSDYSWPGNVRELGNTIELAIILSQGQSKIGPEHLNLPSSAGAATSGQVVLRFAEPPTLEELRDTYLDELIARYEGNRRRIATVLGISERNLYRLLKPSE